MIQSVFLFLLSIFIVSCAQEPAQQPVEAKATDLKKLRNATNEQIQQLRDAGAEIIVREPEYVIIRTDNLTQTLSLSFEVISEKDLVQRLVNIYLQDGGDLQQIVDTGVDFWEAKGDTVVARAFDIHIEKLRAAGFTVEVIAQDAGKMKEDDR